MFMTLRLLLIAALIGRPLGSSAWAEESPPLWGGLRPGPHPVGFRSHWQKDYSRRYDLVLDSKAPRASTKSPRPILINVWYPATRTDSPTPMRHRDYLRIESQDPQLAQIAAALIDYERRIVCKELIGKKLAELDEKERARLEALWDTLTAAYRDAPPVDRRFPMVIYHGGAQSSYEENAVFCEFLASHGYVVVGSAFQDLSGDSFNIDGNHGSARDFEFLINHAGQMPNVDWQHIGLIGHSGGAQAVLLFRAHDASVVDAVVSLDTTQDYYSLKTRGWEVILTYVVDHVDNMDGPLLMVANDHAIFHLADTLVKSDRYYLTTHELGHNEFMAQGNIRKMLECRARPDDRAVESAYQAARAQYDAICECALLFFDAHLKGDRAGLEKLARQPVGIQVGSRPHVEHVPRGVAGAEPFRLDSPTPPAPRQVRELMQRLGVGPTLELLKRYHEKSPSAAVFHGVLGLALIDEFVEQNRIRDAIAVDRCYAKFDPSKARAYFQRAIRCEELGLRFEAIDYFKKALLLDPDDAEAAAHLKNVKESKQPSGGR
jgi:pimeloyl-ACP methyl ester carboxylesterase